MVSREAGIFIIQNRISHVLVKFEANFLLISLTSILNKSLHKNLPDSSSIPPVCHVKLL